MKIYIKNMVCLGTRFFVIQELKGLGFKYNSFESGEIDFEDNLSRAEKKKLYQSMQQYGLELKFVESDLLSKIRYSFLNR
ncbi:MAG: hypothetical protein WA816_13230 [Bacteroidales bacterium]